MSTRPDARAVRLTVRELAGRLDCPFEGDGSVVLTGVAGLDEAGPGQLSYLAHPRFRPFLGGTHAAALVLGTGEAWDRTPVIRAENPQLAFIRATEIFFTPYRPGPGVHPTAVVAPTARIGKDASIGPLCWIGDGAEIGDGSVLHPLVAVYPRVRIGRNVVIHAQVTIREDVAIGDNVILHAGVVVGSDGFAYVKGPDGAQRKIPQTGTVRIEDDVEVGANSTIDRAALGATVTEYSYDASCGLEPDKLPGSPWVSSNWRTIASCSASTSYARWAATSASSNRPLSISTRALTTSTSATTILSSSPSSSSFVSSQ